MKKIVLAVAAFVLAIGFAGCGKSSAPEEKVGRFASLEEMGYTLDEELIPALIREDSVIQKGQEVCAPFDLRGKFTTIGAYHPTYTSVETVEVAFLQAAPAGCTHLEGGILAAEAVPAWKYREYVIFSNEEIVVYDMYPILCPRGPMPEWVKHRDQDAWYDNFIAYKVGEISEDEYLDVPLSVKQDANRSLDYVWAYYQENLPNLIVKMEQNPTPKGVGFYSIFGKSKAVPLTVRGTQLGLDKRVAPKGGLGVEPPVV